ncbi:pirin family protein [Azonexus sp.]|uniref:pirin family protein n=1 Tax=Azonexus sp. TaxID=1872668 RepID=UPI0039E2717C
MNPQTPLTLIQRSRSVEAQLAGHATSDGAGVRLTRLLTQKLQRRLDPFLLLDAFGSDDPDDYIAGFPDHPHRGFETITYMLEGRMRHRDSAGHEGVLATGGVQWMTAGRGVIHSEIPEQEAGRMEGFQLWLNLPAADKLCAPWYKDFPAAELPRYRTQSGVAVTVIAGASQGLAGAVTRPATQPLYLDIDLPAGGAFEQPLAAHNAFVVVYRGAVEIAGEDVSALQLAILANDPAADGVRLVAREASRALLVAGQPLHEPIVQQGPFVMNDEQGIHQAIKDYRNGRLA